MYKLTYWPRFDANSRNFFGVTCENDDVHSVMNDWTLHRQEVCWLRNRGGQWGTALWTEWECAGGWVGGQWLSKPGEAAGAGHYGWGVLRAEKVGGSSALVCFDCKPCIASVSATMHRPTKWVRAGLSAAAVCRCKHHEMSCIGTSGAAREWGCRRAVDQTETWSKICVCWQLHPTVSWLRVWPRWQRDWRGEGGSGVGRGGVRL